MKNILYIITHLGTGGAQEYLLTILDHIDHSKYNVSVIAGYETNNCLAKFPVKFCMIPELKRQISPIDDLKALFKILKFIKNNNIEIVHTNSSKAGILGRIAAKLSGVQLIIHTVHGYPFDAKISMLKKYLYFLIEKFVSLFTNKIITVARWNREKGIHLKIAPREKFTLIRNGFDIKKITDAAMEKAPDYITEFCSSFDTIIGTVWRIDPAKGYPTFIKAADQLIKDNRKKKTGFVMVGDGPDRKILEQLVANSPNSDHFLICGDESNVFPILKLFDVFWLTSYWESLPRSICESLIVGIPVVAPFITGIPEVIIDEVTGFCYQVKDYHELVSKTLRILSNPDLKNKLLVSGYNLITSEFSISETVSKLDFIYHNC